MRRVLLWLTVASVSAAAAPVVDGCGMEGPRIVARRTVAALPEPLRAFFEPRLDAVLEHAVEPAGRWMVDARHASRGQWHYTMLDAAAADGSPEGRLAAARAFPPTASAARRLFHQQGIEDGGRLLWQLESLTEDLSAAFRKGSEDDVVTLAGYVVHFAADAADPFCTTRNNRGHETGSAIFGEVPLGDPLFAHQDVAHRVGWELTRRNGHRYLENVKVTEGSRAYSGDVHAVVLETMLASLARLNEVCAADAGVLEQMGIADGAAFLARQDEYYVLLDARCGDVCVDCLGRGTELAVHLIALAWDRAGSPAMQPDARPPSVAEGRPVTTSPPAVSPQNAPAAGSALFVASKNSKVFHTADCPHAKRINEENRVEFQTVQEAMGTGRRPCKTCRPDRQ